MASVRAFVVFSVLCLAAVYSADQKSSLDAVDIDAVFRNERLLKNYVECLLDEKPCSKEGAELKTRVPKVLETNCEDCSQSERDRAVKAIKMLSSKKPELWAKVKAKYDPTGAYSESFNKRYGMKV